MSWELFTRIVDQVPDIARVVLHGVGEPMLVKDLPRMVRYLKDRGAYVLFNTNGTLLTPRKGRELVDSRARRAARLARRRRRRRLTSQVRGKDFFDRILRNVRAFTEMQAREGLREAARLDVAHRPARDGGAAPGFRPRRRTRSA